MTNAFSNKVVTLYALLAILLLLISAFTGLNRIDVKLSPVRAPVVGQSIKLTCIPPSSPIDVELSLARAPVVGQSTKLTCIVTSVIEAVNVTAEIILPEGITRVEGDLSWSGDIPARGTVEVESVIEVSKAGNCAIQATAGYSFGKDSWYGDLDRLYISIPEDSAHVGPTFDYKDSAIPVEAPPDVAGLPFRGITPEPRLESSLPESPGTLTVRGRFWCYISEDSVPSLGQIRNDELRPMCWGTVWIFRYSDNAFLGGDITGPKDGLAEGYFEIPIENPGAYGFYVVMLPWTSACHVTYPDGSEYRSYTPAFYPSLSDTIYDIGGWRPPDQWDYSGAWRIYESVVLDYYDRGAWDFMANEGPAYVPPEVTVRYKMPDGWGTGIDLISGIIYIDTIDFSKALDIAQHEYAHWVMYNAYSKYWPPNAGGTHYINLRSNTNMGWTEGWADFFPLVCQSYGRWEDSVFEWGTGSQVNLETPTWGTSGWDEGDEVEGHVAGALWDVYDIMNEGLDTFTGGLLDMWDVLRSQTDDTFAQYYSAWRSAGKNSHTMNFEAYQNTIDYNLFPVLSDGVIDPQTGYRDTEFTLLVKYVDQDADPAVVKRIYVYDSGWQYFEMDSFVGNPIDGEWFVKTISGFSAGNHDFFFYFTDGIDEEYDPDTGYYSFTVLTAPDLSAFPLTFALDGAVNSTVVVGTSDPHGPCGSAHTLDTVGGMGVAAILGRYGSVANARFYLDTDIAWYNQSEWKVYYWPVEGLTNIITVAGPGVNMITWRYFCNPWYAPVYMYYDDGLGEQIIITPTTTYYESEWVGSQPLRDLAVLEVIYVPEEGRYVLWVGGFGGYATRAGCLALQLFDTGQLPFTLEGRAMLIQWIDENGNAKVDPVDTWNIIEIVP